MRHPTEIVDLILAFPARDRRPATVLLPTSVNGRCGTRAGVEKIPKKNLAIVATRGKGSPPKRGPLETVDGPRVAAQLEKGLAGLPNVENSNHARVLGESG